MAEPLSDETLEMIRELVAFLGHPTPSVSTAMQRMGAAVTLGYQAFALLAEVDRLRGDLSKLVDAYIHKQTHPERQPGYRYRATLAIGFETWTDDLEEARRKVRRAAGLEADA
jgi:deferrochelatase/peroxidase EfeB